MTTIPHVLVSSIPKALEPRTLYVCPKYDLVVHLCLCGCSAKVVTPLGPAQWSVRFEDGDISLSPSIGNGALPCRSHYWITRGRVHWLPPIGALEHAAAAARDHRDVAAHLTRERVWWRRLFTPVRIRARRWFATRAQ
ncbi:DUF6527 family protein [Actinotalea sp. Marseille-Q4924]|uniref:DUF6527 family protein n=1 Tax=Actinotalea sp. Marseille-Q4924 TaxID=2866571 RepID=UPI001CE4260D|nr:DUF6527 family protein [Actinotalea sp. Marseille-Q4924]